MRLLDLCAGIGGFTYAAHKLGWTTAAFCERDEFCQKVLAKNFPGVPIYDDVYTFPSEPFRGRIDVLTGGFPCQPFSQAGKRLGVDDERHLFPEMLRIMREVQPAFAVFENVNGLVSMALEIRDTKLGRTKYSRDEAIDDYEAIYAREETMLLNRICEDIEAEGYAVQPVIIPAVALEADHERKRIWIVARRNASNAESPNGSGLPFRETAEYAVSGRLHRDAAHANDAGDRTRESGDDVKRPPLGIEWEQPQPESSGHGFDALSRHCREGGVCYDPNKCDGHNCYLRRTGIEPDVANPGCEYGQSGRNDGVESGTSERSSCVSDTERCGHDALNAPCDGSQGFGGERDCPAQARLQHREHVRWPANWYEAAQQFCRVPDETAVGLDEPRKEDHRVDRLKALGNAIYWPVAFEIFKAIDSCDEPM